MKRILLVCVAACLFSTGFAQTDTTGKKEYDTIRIGGMIIVRKPGTNEREIITSDKKVKIPSRKYKNENVTTNWWVFDIGYSGFSDKTDYASPAAQAFAPGDQKSIALNQPENINNLPKEGPRTTAALTDGITPDVKVLEEKDATGVSTNGNDVIPVDLANSAVTLKDNPSLYIPGPEKGRGGGLKELLRKTTRVFERRTKIQTTTEDNKLLVGVFAVSLK